MAEENKEKLLSWRPQNISDAVPEDVYDARMSLLSGPDAEALASEFKSRRDDRTKFLYFGGDAFGELGSNASGLMVRCAYVGKDRETTLRLFKASAYASQIDEKLIPDMLKESLEFVENFRPVMAKMGSQFVRHEKLGYCTHRNYYGKY